MPQQKLYPALSTLIQLDSLPEILSNLGEDLLGKVFYKTYYSEKSVYGDVAYHNITLVLDSKTGFNLFGGDDGFQLLFNPGSVNGTTELPIALYYNLPILKYIQEISLQNFDSAEDYFNLIIKILNIPIDEILGETIKAFFGDSGIADFISQFNEDPDNAAYPALQVSDASDFYGSISEILEQFHTDGIDIFQFILVKFIDTDGSDIAKAFDNIASIFQKWVGTISLDDFKLLFIPKFTVTIPTLQLALAFPRTWVKPVDANNNEIEGDVKSLLRYNIGALEFSSTNGFDFTGASNFSFDRSEIGSTGLILEFTNAKLDLSRTSNIPEATAAGYPLDFIGVYVQEASITLSKFGDDNTAKPSASIIADNLLIGTGGVSGTIKLTDNGLLHRKFGSFEVELDAFSITFKQNAIVNSTISGKITLPAGFQDDGNPSIIQIDGSIADNGDFKISGTFLGEPPTFTFPNVFKVYISKLEVGEKGGRFYLSVAGKLDFIADIPGLGDVLPKGVIINKLIIWDNGDIEFDGGGLTVPKAFSLKVGPVKLEVSNISIGSHTRKHNNVDREYYYFGFDGMINTGNAGVAVGGNGIKYYFTHDDGPEKPFDSYISIDGIEIDISIPGENPNFILKGFLSMKNPDPSITGSTAGIEYTGRISVALPKLDIFGSATMRLNPDVPAFVVDMGLELSTPIPLGATSLGIYGFRGLIGKHYLPSKAATTPPLPDDATWWDYYKAKSTLTHTEGIEIDKFASKSGFSLGAGISIATEFDGGFIFSSKLFLLLGLPDVFLIQGQAGIIRDRIGLQDDVDPPFSALIVISSQSIQGNLGVNFNLPDSGQAKGWIMSLQAQLDMAFFFNNASGWYINIGKDTPATARVQASLLTIFKGHAYLMISSQGIKAGAGISFDFNKKFGPVQVGFGASLDMGGFISFKPVQIGGFIQVSGYAYLKVWKFKFGLSIAVALAIEAPHPFNMTGSLRVKLNLPWPIPDIKFTLDISWHFNNDQGPLLAPVAVLGLPSPETGYIPAIATNIMSNETFQVNYVTSEDITVIPHPGDAAWKFNFTLAADAENVIIPLDSFIDIQLLKPVIPGNAPIGGASNQLPVGYTEMIPPVKGVGKQVKHQYELTSLGIYSWNNAGAAWVPYNIYEAVTAIVDDNTGTDAIDLSQLKPGYWQFTDKDKYNKIRLLSQNMFSFTNGTISDQLDLDGRNFKGGDLFCYESIQKINVVNWKAVPVDTAYPDDTPVSVQTLTLIFNGVAASVKNETSFNATSLFINGAQGDVIITFPEPIANVKMEFGDNTNNAQVSFIKSVYTPGDFGQTIFSDVTVSSYPLTAAQQNAVISYDDINTVIDKVRLQFNAVVIPNYTGSLVIGGHFQLPAQYITAGLNGGIEMDRSLMFPALYNRSFTAAEVLQLEYSGQPGLVAQWPLDSLADDAGDLNAVLVGSPDFSAGFYKKDSALLEQLHNVYSFTGNDDAVTIPYNAVINLENSSFAVEATVIFNPFSPGISTLLYKVNENFQTGDKKGYAIHLIQNTPAHPLTRYTDAEILPSFNILFTCYNGQASSAITISEKYTLNCSDGNVATKQYKRVFVSVDREAGTLDLYIDRVLKSSTAIPAELGVTEIADGATYTYLNQVTYTTETEQARQDDNPITSTDFINEVQVLNDAINKTIQPVWRPDTTFAVIVQTQDRVNGNVPSGSRKTHIFGFKTAGPLGHFHQQSKAYQALVQADQTDAFKLANLKYYINYDRSFPDAQGRYDLSKPVFCHNPQVKLYFTQPYINAMYNNWDSYHGMPAVQSKLELQLLDPAGSALTQQLVWEPVQEIPINNTNYSTLPPDQQMVYLFNQAASQGGCNPLPGAVVKKLKQGSYQFPDLIPNKLYTALFNAVYTADGNAPDSVEVHKFGFITSRYTTFQEQAGSFVLDSTPGAEKYAVHPQLVAFDNDYIEQVLKKLINADSSDDPESVMKYAVPYERLVYGGLKLAAPESFDNSAISLVVNTNPSDNTVKLLGILIYNPEPFNDPKLPADSLTGTIKLTLTLPDNTIVTPDELITIYSRDNSAAFITNTAMDIVSSNMQFSFRYKIFNGIDYETLYEDYNSPAINMAPWF